MNSITLLNKLFLLLTVALSVAGCQSTKNGMGFSDFKRSNINKQQADTNRTQALLHIHTN